MKTWRCRACGETFIERPQTCPAKIRPSSLLTNPIYFEIGLVGLRVVPPPPWTVCGSSNIASRTLIRVVDLDEKEAHLILPGFDVRQKVKIPLKDFPKKIRSILVPGKRLHAQVNLGAEEAEDLRFTDWESE